MNERPGLQFCFVQTSFVLAGEKFRNSSTGHRLDKSCTLKSQQKKPRIEEEHTFTLNLLLSDGPQHTQTDKDGRSVISIIQHAHSHTHTATNDFVCFLK